VQQDWVVLSHPDVGDITLDCDLLAVSDGDLLVMIFTGGPGFADAARLGELVGGAGEPAAVRVGQAGPG
jgi:hypothetical protein